jgi:hypothetical protein
VGVGFGAGMRVGVGVGFGVGVGGCVSGNENENGNENGNGNGNGGGKGGTGREGGAFCFLFFFLSFLFFLLRGLSWGRCLLGGETSALCLEASTPVKLDPWRLLRRDIIAPHCGAGQGREASPLLHGQGWRCAGETCALPDSRGCDAFADIAHLYIGAMSLRCGVRCSDS